MTTLNPTLVVTDSKTQVAERNGARKREAVWFIAGLVVFFVVPWLGTDVGDLNHDLYYLVYIAATVLFLGRYGQATGIDVAKLVRRRWHLSVLLGLAATAFVVVNVLRNDATDRPTGAYLVFEIVWRGLAYGNNDQYRNRDIVAPEIGNTIISVPMIATLNPVGAVMAHAAMHVTANIHAYETDVFLPPGTMAP